MDFTVTNDNFGAEVENAELPVLLDFWAAWCGPCKMISPIIDRIAEKYEGKLNVGRVNVDDCPDLAMKFNITNIPTLLVMKSGEAVAELVGAARPEAIEELVLEHL